MASKIYIYTYIQGHKAQFAVKYSDVVILSGETAVHTVKVDLSYFDSNISAV